ncbi:MAG: molybdopterin-dependent oxidoreductase, partial [Pirellulaceae bacterium]
MPAQEPHEFSLNRRHWLGMAATGTAVGLIVQPRAFAQQQPAGGKQLIVHGTQPTNAEPELNRLVRSWETPVKHFYVRSHAPVPKVDLDSFRLTVEGMVQRNLSLSIAEVAERFPATEITATMTCAGNRRNEHSRVKKVGGVQWAA